MVTKPKLVGLLQEQPVVSAPLRTEQPVGPLALERVLTDEQRETLREHMKAGGKELREGQQK
jgi:hypothetical protein